jgi:NADH:ubiquinone oxidoreductase subunit F (NADH-binding)
MADIYGDSETTCGRKQLIDELAETMKLTSICGLGTVASNPITSLLNYFREDVIRYTTDDVQRFS